MSSPDPEWWEVRAGEYVLGTLDAKERELFGRILRHDRDLRRSVVAWEARLAPLDAATPSRMPPGRVWEAIARGVRAKADDEAPVTRAPVTTPSGDADDRLAFAEPDDTSAVDAGAGDGSSAHLMDGTVVDIGSSSRRNPPRRGLFVPFVAAFATAASLILGVLLQQQHERLDALEGSILQADGISVILGEDGAPLWLVQADFEGERVRVTALAPPPDDGGGDYQLWQVLPDGGGVAAVSLLPGDDGVSSETPVPGIARRFDAFAVSLEPDGGSPEAVPTGTVLYQGGVVYADDEGGS